MEHNYHQVLQPFYLYQRCRKSHCVCDLNTSYLVENSVSAKQPRAPNSCFACLLHPSPLPPPQSSSTRDCWKLFSKSLGLVIVLCHFHLPTLILKQHQHHSIVDFSLKNVNTAVIMEPCFPMAHVKWVTECQTLMLQSSCVKQALIG